MNTKPMSVAELKLLERLIYGSCNISNFQLLCKCKPSATELLLRVKLYKLKYLLIISAAHTHTAGLNVNVKITKNKT